MLQSGRKNSIFRQPIKLGQICFQSSLWQGVVKKNVAAIEKIQNFHRIKE